MVVQELTARAIARAGDRTVKDVRAGLGYTCVMLEDGACGLAYTFRNQLGCTCGILSDAGSMIGRKAEELISWAEENNLLRSAVGVATINAVMNDRAAAWDTGNVIEAIEVGPEDSFGMVGEFGPILNKVNRITRSVFVFEARPAGGQRALPQRSDPGIPSALRRGGAHRHKHYQPHLRRRDQTL
jgi:uncharacterized protein (DUF4213/DUF364 family)